ncbi:MAG: VTT domain-containing protein [Candidatus Omnitrophota bacterium]|nr:VTT domain-containing protein [Candidatus Omnitrophota bacterium]
MYFFSEIPLFFQGFFFVLFYCFTSFFLWLAKDLMKIAGVFIFGPWWSSFYIFIAEIINACVLFYFARYLGRGFVEQKAKGRFKGLDERIAKSNFFWLLLLRAAPLVPFRFLDLAAGLTGIHFRKYLFAVISGSPLRILWVQIVLYGVGEGVFNYRLLSEYFIRHPSIFLWSFLYILLIIPVVLKFGFKE